MANNNNNNADFQRALAMSIHNRPNNNNANLRNALRQSANNNRQRLRKEMNREYEAAMAANALAANAAKQANAKPEAPGINFNQMLPMLPNMKPKVNNSKVAKAMRIATPENTAALAEMFPQFPYAQIEKMLKQSKGNVNATRKNLVRRKAILKLGGTRKRNNSK